MKNLDYKGFKSTRFVGTLLVFSVSSLFLALGLIEAGHWTNIAIWTLGIYAGSEAGAKFAEAISNKGNMGYPS